MSSKVLRLVLFAVLAARIVVVVGVLLAVLYAFQYR